MSQSKVIAALILFHFGAFKNLKHFYLYFIKDYLAAYFPQTVSDNSFVGLMRSVAQPMALFLKICCLRKSAGISFVDSTPIRVYKNKRIPRHKIFDGIAQKSQSTIGYFFGFKLHFIINDKEDALNFALTPRNTDDWKHSKKGKFIEKKVQKIIYG